MFERLVSSHVGSFPLQHSWNNVLKVFKDLIEIGVDIPPFPQMRSFINMYLEPLVEIGILKKHGLKYLGCEKTLLEMEPLKIEIKEAHIVSNEARKYGIEMLRAPITGPLTLSSKVYFSEGGLSSTAIASKDVTLGFFVEYVKNIVKQMVNLGYNLIVIDEPILAIIVGRKTILFGYKPEDIIEIYHNLFKPAKNAFKGIHVCGKLPASLPKILVQIDNLNILNHGFKDSIENLEVFSKDLLEKYDKILSPGIISSRKMKIESFEETYRLLIKLLEKFENRVNVISADCGFGALKSEKITFEEAYNIAKKKLHLLVSVVRKANIEKINKVI